MKKVILIILCLILTGCGKYNVNSATRELEKKIGNLKAYRLSGVLELTNNDDVYNYDVDVSFKKKDMYKVSLVNKNNKHEQILLRNKEGVYVLTPALNKSFKFQSDWPYSTSQIYLLKAILDDIKNDSKRKFYKEKGKYIFTTKVNYTTNKKLVKQNVILDRNMNIKKVEVFDRNDIPLMRMTFKKIDYSPTFKDSYFNLPSSLATNKKAKTTSKIEDTVYPLNIPVNTKLTKEEKIDKTNGERILMTFEGEKPFLLVEETANVEDEFTIIPTYGEPYMLSDTIGVMADNSLSWSSSGMEYYIVSDVMNSDELVEIAKSINVLPTMK